MPLPLTVIRISLRRLPTASRVASPTRACRPAPCKTKRPLPSGAAVDVLPSPCSLRWHYPEQVRGVPGRTRSQVTSPHGVERSIYLHGVGDGLDRSRILDRRQIAGRPAEIGGPAHAARSEVRR